MSGNVEEAENIMRLLRQATVKQPDDLFTTQTYVGFLANFLHAVGPQFDIASCLDDLNIHFSNPHTDKVQMAQLGLQVWMKYFEDPKLGKKLMRDEQMSSNRVCDSI